MATKKKKAKTSAKEPGKVVCFFFYGSIDELGGALAQFADESQAVTELAEWAKGFAPPPR